ncbi:MAG: tRNA threonylcarbamoyladenosine dehydratase [Proteobacteria bacterium]|nr:tRNA threonylcarbamoyladenosine dehydratase [Pseudomonadota bacterium]
MNQFARTEQLLGRDAMEKIRQARVAVFGLGAVGSFATEALARAGVGYLRLVDFDRVDASNINRQLYALNSTIGRQKAKLAKERVEDINPLCTVDVHHAFVNAESLTDLLSQDLTVVVDAIDGLNSKVNLIFGAAGMGLPVVSSMGAGGKTDISLIKTGDLSQTCVCPLARVVRQRLHRRGLYQGVTCVYSIEKPLNKQPYAPADAAETLSGHGRSRPPIGTIPWVPGVFGLNMAAEAAKIIVQAGCI